MFLNCISIKNNGIIMRKPILIFVWLCLGPKPASTNNEVPRTSSPAVSPSTLPSIMKKRGYEQTNGIDGMYFIYLFLVGFITTVA